MTQVQRVKRNSLFALLSHLVRLTTNFLLFVGVARLYGVETFGQFTTAHTFATIFLLVADFGFDSLLQTHIAKQRDTAAALARKCFTLKLLFATSAFLALLAFPFLYQFTQETELLVRIFSLYVFVGALNNFFFSLFKGYEEFQHETKISFATNALLLLLLVVLGFLKAPIETVAAAFVGTRLLGTVIASVVARRLTGSPVMRLDFTGLRTLWPTVIVFGLQFIFGALYFTLDTILLALWRGDHDVGIYQSVFKLAVLALLIPDIAVNTMMPFLSRLHGEGDHRWASFGKLLHKTLLMIGLPVSVVLFVYADQIVVLLYGAGEFEQAIPILRIFAVIVLIRFAVEPYALMLTTSHRQRVRMLIVMAGTAINVALNAVAIPAYGPFGAGVVSLVTNALVGTAFVATSRQPIREWSLQGRLLLALAAGGGIATMAWLFRSLSLWFGVPLVLLLFAVVIYTAGYTRAERQLLFGFGGESIDG